MANSTGIGAQLGISTVESAYGTYTAPTTFNEFTSESLRRVNEYIRTTGIRAGRAFQSENLHQQTTHRVEGNVQMEVLDQGMGKWLNLLHPNTVTPAAYTGGLYRQTHNIGNTGLSDPKGKFVTIQVGRPDVGGTVRAFSYSGCKLGTASFSLERGGIVTADFAVDGQTETTSESLESATYAADAKPFTFQDATIEFDDSVLTDCVRSATVEISLPMDTERFCIGSGATKKEPLLNGPVAVTLTLDMEFTSLTQHTAFINSTRRKVELLCGGQTESGTYASALNFTAASTVATGEGPVVEGPDILTQQVTLEVLDDGSTTPFVIEHITADSTL